MTTSNVKPDLDRTSVHPLGRRRRVPRFDLSATQLAATALAAITATFVASYLGVSGTIIGAAVASVATAIGNAVYGQSLRSTRERVRVVVPARRTRTDPASPTIISSQCGPGRREASPEPCDGPPTLPAAGGQRARGAERSDPRRPAATPALAWRRVALVAAGVFAAVLAVVTSVEMLAGRPVTDLVRGDSGSGTTLFGVGTSKDKLPPPVPTVTTTVTPSVVVTTPTVTQTAPAVTKTAPQTAAPTTTPPTTPSDTGTPSPSAPSQSGSPSPRG
ncbi:MAG: hypothetical protein ACR2LX_14625 [Jatrophihabitans sp.]